MRLYDPTNKKVTTSGWLDYCAMALGNTASLRFASRL